MDEQQQQQQKKKNKITCRSSVDGQLKANNLPDMLLKISDAMDGDIITVTLRLPRTVPRRVSFGTNIKFVVGFCIFASEIFYFSVLNEPMNQEKSTLLGLMLFSASLIFILLIEMSQLAPHRLILEEQRRLRLVGWFQEAIIVVVSITMVYWILRTPVEQ